MPKLTDKQRLQWILIELASKIDDPWTELPDGWLNEMVEEIKKLKI